jgi:hypothetical protein
MFATASANNIFNMDTRVLYYGSHRSCNDDYCPSIEEVSSRLNLLNATADPELEEYDAALERSYYHDDIMSRRLSDDDDSMDIEPTVNDEPCCFWGPFCPECDDYEGLEEDRYRFSCFNCDKPMNDHEGYLDEINGHCCNFCAVKLWDSPEEEARKRKVDHCYNSDEDYQENDEQYNKKYRINREGFEMDVSDDAAEDETLSLINPESQMPLPLNRLSQLEFPEGFTLTVTYEGGKRYINVVSGYTTPSGPALTLADLTGDDE